MLQIRQKREIERIKVLKFSNFLILLGSQLLTNLQIVIYVT